MMTEPIRKIVPGYHPWLLLGLDVFLTEYSTRPVFSLRTPVPYDAAPVIKDKRTPNQKLRDNLRKHGQKY